MVVKPKYLEITRKIEVFVQYIIVLKYLAYNALGILKPHDIILMALKTLPYVAGDRL